MVNGNERGENTIKEITRIRSMQRGGGGGGGVALTFIQNSLQNESKRGMLLGSNAHYFFSFFAAVHGRGEGVGWTGGGGGEEAVRLRKDSLNGAAVKQCPFRE